VAKTNQLQAFLPPAFAELTTARDSLTADLQQASTKQADTDAQLADSKAQIEKLTKELDEAQQAATAAAEEAAATKAQLEQQLTGLQEAQVRPEREVSCTAGLQH
jgi:predicted  nucleic acid-binding Zn-ribbon protein